MARERNETSFRNASSKDGSFSPHIGKATTERLTKYCKEINKNRTKFVEECINERLDVLEQEFLNGLTKEQLIEMLMRGR